MSITKSRLQQIIKEEVARVAESYGSSGSGGRGGRYTGGGTTGYKGSYNDTPWYRQGGSGRMSDAEARARSGRGYDEPDESNYERSTRGGLVHSTVSIYVDPAQAADKFNANLGPRLDSAADVFLGMSGYDGMSGNLIVGKDMETGFNKIGPRWVLGKGAGGYTFTIEGVVGNGATPSEALADAAGQGFQGSDVVLNSLGMGGGMESLEESRDLSKESLAAGEPVNMRKVRMIANKMINKYADNPESLELEVQELGDIYQGYDAESPIYKTLNRAEAITLRDILARESSDRFMARQGGGDIDGAGDFAPSRNMTQYTDDNLYESRWNKLAGILKD